MDGAAGLDGPVEDATSVSAQDDSQDFEKYARIKPMQGAVAESWMAPFRSHVLPRLPDTSTARALDYGFGDGRFFDVLSRHFAASNVHGVEVSELRAARARARGWSNARVIPSSAPLPYEDASFDFVNMVEVIEHIPSDAIGGCLSEIARVMKPDGTMLLTTPNYPIKRVYDALDSVKLRRWTRLRDDPTHVSFYNHRSLERRLCPHFRRVHFLVFKEGLFYSRTGWRALCHKMLAVCTEPIPPAGVVTSGSRRA
jgi:SAM-dependent methyltransferase